MARLQQPTAVDLFCGCGGLSCGLRAAGFKILAGIDLEPKYIGTFSRNFPESISLKLDIAETPPEEFMLTVGISSGELTLLAGGPPCQGFSKNVPRKQRHLNSANNRLVKTFLDYCEAIRPELILMENVAEMKNGFDQAYTEEIVARLGKSGYAVTHGVLNAADYGVPQRRRRSFFIANRDGISLKFPQPTHGRGPRTPMLFSSPTHVTVWDAIGDLPSVDSGEGQDRCSYACEPFSEYQSLIRQGALRSRTTLPEGSGLRNTSVSPRYNREKASLNCPNTFKRRAATVEHTDA